MPFATMRVIFYVLRGDGKGFVDSGGVSA